jgi:hypothetical protein
MKTLLYSLLLVAIGLALTPRVEVAEFGLQRRIENLKSIPLFFVSIQRMNALVQNLVSLDSKNTYKYYKIGIVRVRDGNVFAIQKQLALTALKRLLRSKLSQREKARIRRKFDPELFTIYD